jgi:hypothetical protein
MARLAKLLGRREPPRMAGRTPTAGPPLGKTSGRDTTMGGQVDHSATGLREQHLLLLPSTVTATEVDELVRARVPDAELATTGQVRLGRRCRFSGPVELSMEDAVDAAVPMPWTLAYALQAPIEREDPPLPGVDDRDGFARAFPDGLPWREEGRALQLMVAMARRLHGVVRVAGGTLIHPDPDRALDVLLHAPVWLEPEAVHGLVARVIPSARLATAGQDWSGPDVEAYSGDRIAEDTAHAPLSSSELAALHRAADEADLAVLHAEDTIDAYAVVADLLLPATEWSADPYATSQAPATRPDGTPIIVDDGAIEVLVHVSQPGEPSVVGNEWANYPFVSYEVRWACPLAEDRERRDPGEAYLASRERVRPHLAAVARYLVEATRGVVTDEDGFWLDRYTL